MASVDRIAEDDREAEGDHEAKMREPMTKKQPVRLIKQNTASQSKVGYPYMAEIV